MFCAPRIVFGGAECVGFRFHVFRSQTRFRRYRRRRVPFSCFALPNSFSAIPRASGPVFMFCALGLIFGGTEGVVSRFHALRSRNHFRRYRGRQVPFHALRSRTRFRRYQGRRVPFSCFPLSESFSVVLRVSGPFFMFCDPGLILCGTESVGFLFHVLYFRTHFRRYRGRRVHFSCFALPDSISAVLWVSSPVFMFSAPGLVFGGTEGVGSRFHILLSRNYFRRCRVCWVPFSCFALPDSFSAVTRASGPVFHVLRARTHFLRYRGRWIPFSCFAHP
jgi:hypothetical protein